MKRESKGKIRNTYKVGKIRCVIGFDQSYSRTGISIAVDGKLKKVTSVKLVNVKSKSAKRLLVEQKCRAAIEACLKKFPPDEIVVLVERIRTFTAGNDLRPEMLKGHGALISRIVDTAYQYGIETYSVDTRAWKSYILGTSQPVFEPIAGVKNPQKFGSVRYVIELGFEESLKITNKGRFRSYDDDAADSACIALYGFNPCPKVIKEM